MKLYRIASYKDKVQKYKISDPFLIFFLQQYENMIPWKSIQSSDDINNYIGSQLLTDLYSRIDPESESNNYLKDIDLQFEFENNQQDPQIQQAFAIHREDPDKAKQTILDAINEQKRNVFTKWWNYITKLLRRMIFMKNLLLSAIVF